MVFRLRASLPSRLLDIGHWESTLRAFTIHSKYPFETFTYRHLIPNYWALGTGDGAPRFVDTTHVAPLDPANRPDLFVFPRNPPGKLSRHSHRPNSAPRRTASSSSQAAIRSAFAALSLDVALPEPEWQADVHLPVPLKQAKPCQATNSTPKQGHFRGPTGCRWPIEIVPIADSSPEGTLRSLQWIVRKFLRDQMRRARLRQQQDLSLIPANRAGDGRTTGEARRRRQGESLLLLPRMTWLVTVLIRALTGARIASIQDRPITSVIQASIARPC